MAADIKVEVDIVERFRDLEGVNYEVSIDWVDTSLPGGALDPNGVELVVECTKKQTPEQVRDKIRADVITLLQLPTGSGGYGFTGLTYANIRVEGYSNEGRDDNKGASGGGSGGNWYNGNPFRPNIPAKNLGIRQTKVRMSLFFDNTLNPDQRDTTMAPVVYFKSGADNTPDLATKLKYWMVAYNAAGTNVWEKEFDTTVTSGTIVPLTAAGVVGGVIDLTHANQAALWTTGRVNMVLELRRVTASRTVIAKNSGKISRASIVFAR